VFALNIRIKFEKSGVMKFIGHLDMVRYFQKAMRRAEIPVAYTNGFSPHQVMSFASPLGVGLTSESEYMDIEINQNISSTAAILALNKTMVEGIRILEFHQLEENSKNAMSIVAAADYRIYPKNPSDTCFLPTDVQNYFLQSTIPVTRQSKKSVTTLDLKECVLELKGESLDGKSTLFMKVLSGSISNIKPELVLASYFSFIEQEFISSNYQVHRLELYANVDGQYKTLGELGEDIHG
jgi:radical SAM-linked protein